ncbi:MAG TPA: SDR family oxidoreductase, partial [Steroidobacteraceae bacterium]|nr:SDR family oxidoreductase [Steroidobacteraceae bacterium]
MHKLHGKRAFVTAGAQGIGLAISRQLLAAGCDVFVHYRTSADAARGLEAEAKALGRRYAHAAADLTKSTECERLVAEAVKFLGGLDVLINNAGSLVARKTLPEADDAFWEEVMSLNLGSARRVTRAAAPHLIAAAKTGAGASIVNLSSLAGRKGGHPGSLVYSTAKGAILTFTRALANELGPQGVRVNAIAPDMANTLQTPADMMLRGRDPALLQAWIPLGRFGESEDYGRVVLFLASDLSGFVT